MSTFTLHTTETAPAAAKEQLAGIEKAWGFVPNLHRTLAESPVTLEAYNALFGLFGKSSFTPAEQQVVYLAINVVNECEYCTSGHSVLAKMAGLDAETISALRDNRPLSTVSSEPVSPKRRCWRLCSRSRPRPSRIT